MKNENEFCARKNRKGVYSVTEDFGYWLYCSDFEKPIEGHFHYYDEPETT